MPRQCPHDIIMKEVQKSVVATAICSSVSSPFMYVAFLLSYGAAAHLLRHEGSPRGDLEVRMTPLGMHKPCELCGHHVIMLDVASRELWSCACVKPLQSCLTSSAATVMTPGNRENGHRTTHIYTMLGMAWGSSNTPPPPPQRGLRPTPSRWQQVPTSSTHTPFLSATIRHLEDNRCTGEFTMIADSASTPPPPGAGPGMHLSLFHECLAEPYHLLG